MNKYEDSLTEVWERKKLFIMILLTVNMKILLIISIMKSMR